jgi:hypothetical protein
MLRRYSVHGTGILQRKLPRNRLPINMPAAPYICHYRKQSLHRELEASARAKPPALGEDPLRREQMFWLSAKGWPTVNNTFAESFLL